MLTKDFRKIFRNLETNFEVVIKKEVMGAKRMKEGSLKKEYKGFFLYIQLDSIPSQQHFNFKKNLAQELSHFVRISDERV